MSIRGALRRGQHLNGVEKLVKEYRRLSMLKIEMTLLMYGTTMDTTRLRNTTRKDIMD